MAGPTPSLRRALEAIGSHQSVAAVRALDETSLAVEVDFRVPMPSRWLGAGRSPTGVRPIETVTFVFHKSYPLVAPDVTLRLDFDRCHPHIQPGRPEDPPRPCYFEGDPGDLLRYSGIGRIVEQIADWLEKAASGSLINFDQGWEPIRRDTINDMIEVDPAFIRNLVNRDGGFAFTLIQHAAIQLPNADRYRAAVVDQAGIALSHLNIQKLLSNTKVAGLSVTVWAGRKPSGGPQINVDYKPETVTTVAGLFARSADYALRERLQSAISLVKRALGTRKLTSPLVLTVFLVVRRPVDVIGQRSPLELIPYVLEVNSADDLSEQGHHPIRPAAIRDAVSRSLLASVAGEADVGRKSWSLLGCGSVGSKIALHLARQGLAPTTVADRSLMHPHNYARHALLPSPMLPIPEPKSHALARAMAALGQESTSIVDDIITAATENPASLAAAWPQNSEFFVDATASPSVTDALCLPNVAQHRPRAIEVSLLGGGSLGYLAIEGQGTNPSVQDLQAEAFRLMANDPTLRTALRAKSSAVVAVGQGCSSLTAQMTDAKLSTFTPAIAERIARALQEGLPPDAGELAIGVVDDSLMDHIWLRQAVPPLRRMRSAKGTRVSVSEHVMTSISNEINSRPSVESGGILIGRFNESTESFHIVDVVAAPPDSKFAATEFILGTEGLSEKLSFYNSAIDGALYPIGTWHNHLDDTSASRTDLETAASISLGQRFPVCLLIRTPVTLRGVVADTDHLKPEPRVSVSILGEEN